MNATNLIAEWDAAIAPDEPHKLERRLHWDGMDQTTFGHWLKTGGSSTDLHAEQCAAALETCKGALQARWDLPLVPYEATTQRAFQDIWWPLRLEMESWLSHQLGSSALIDGAIYGSLAESLLDRLCSTTEPALWHCFSSGRGPGAMLLAHLGTSRDGSGPPVRELYEQFVQQHRRDGLASVLEHYPVLGNLIGVVLNLWQIATVEMLTRIENDRAALEQTFAIPQNARLTGIKQGLSDPHRGGRAVAILSFAGSPNEARSKVVYKPKDMGVDAAYQALLSDLNSNSVLAPLRTLAIQTGDGYGYMEMVEHQLCDNEHDLEKFYTNAGRLTAILHLLGCTDCHHENLIASRDQLLLIDTETLLEADLPDHIREADASNETVGPSKLQQRFQRSVLRSGLLPQWMFMGQAKRAIDISALGITPPASENQQQPGWLGINSDGMMPGRVSHRADVPTSLPVGIGAANPFPQCLDSFCSGFATQSEALIAQRERWLQPSSALNRFAGLQRRIVLRATRVYFALQRQQLEPAALRSPQAQALKLEQLARSFLLAETKPLHWPVFGAERRQMQQLDIPFFTHRIDGNALELDEKGTTLAGFIKTSGLQAARERLRSLNEEEIHFQMRLIRGTVQAKQLRVNSPLTKQDSSRSRSKQTDNVSTEQACQRIAEQLLNMAIRDPEGQVEWLGMDLGADGECFGFGPVGLSLYGGSIGIACLLKQLQNNGINHGQSEESYQAILRPLHQLAQQENGDGRRRWWRDQPLGLSGCGGILLALLQLGERTLAEALLEEAQPRFIEADQQLDMIGGCAGLIGALLALNTPQALELAEHAGRHLLNHQAESGGWHTNPRRSALLGYSHGTAGVATALAKLHQRTGHNAFACSARAALVYERAQFNGEQGNWPDLRTEQPGFMVSWCHGAPGIGLGRACLWGTDLWDERCEEEITTAIHTTAAVNSIGADHVCCGSLGLMLVLQLLTSGPWSMSRETHRIGQTAADAWRDLAIARCSEETLQLRCFRTMEGGIMLPGFFSGLSGMGMALLNSSASQTLISAGLNQPQ